METIDSAAQNASLDISVGKDLFFGFLGQMLASQEIHHTYE